MISILRLTLLSLFLLSFSVLWAGEAGSDYRNIIEYGRGFSSSATHDLTINYGGSELTFHNLVMEPEANSWADSNGAIFQSKNFSDFISSSTEPYYGLRFHRFLQKYPQFGWGLEHTHFKVFLNDVQQNVHITGNRDGQSVDEHDFIYKYIGGYSISHGINHLSVNGVYRLRLLQSASYPDGRIQPYVSLSLGPVIPHFEINYLEDGYVVARAYEYQPSWKNWGAGINLGSRFRITPRFGIYTEFKTTYSFLHGMSIKSSSGEEGDVKTSFLINHFQFGLSLYL